MRLHVLTLPHTATHPRFSPCAYSEKVRKFVTMMGWRGYDVVHYGNEGSEVPCEHVQILSRADQLAMIPGLDSWHTGFFPIEWGEDVPYWQVANFRMAEEVKRRRTDDDILCCIMGCQRPVAQMVGAIRACEFGIGYGGVFSQFRVFESEAWRHALSGENADVRWWDTVIHNYFDPDQFPMGKGQGGYVLFIGRCIERKGIRIAIETCRRAGLPLKIAGQGGSVKGGEFFWDGGHASLDGIEYVGVVGPEERAALMGDAICLMAPTIYLGPFEGVAAEAQMCGTPAVTTDWGAYTETVEDGVSGFRCMVLKEFVDAVNAAPSLDRAAIRKRALRMFSMDSAAERYDRYFKRIQLGAHPLGWGHMPED